MTIKTIKTWTLQLRAADRTIFNEIKEGSKTIETRANTERYAAIKAGDNIMFVCGEERIAKKIKKVLRFKTIAGMLRTLPRKKIMPSASSVKEMRKVYYGFPGYKEKIKEFGIVAMVL